MLFLFILAMLILLFGVAMLIVGKVHFDPDSDDHPVSIRGWALIPLGIGGLLLLLSILRVVSVGSVGIPVTFGSAGSPMKPGIHLVAPWTSVKKMNLREQQYVMVHQNGEGTQAGDDSLQVLGSDGGSASVDSTLLFKLEPDKASTLYKRVGTSYINQIIRPSARSCIGTGFTTDSIVDAATDGRATMQKTIHDCLVEKLGTYDILVDDFQLRAIVLPDATQKAVDSKIAANQGAQQKVFDLAAAEGDANITRVKAKATADSQQILACGGTAVSTKDSLGKPVTSVIPNAKGHCDQAQLTPAFLQYSYIQALTAMANSPNHSTVIVPTGQSLTPLINTP